MTFEAQSTRLIIIDLAFFHVSVFSVHWIICCVSANANIVTKSLEANVWLTQHLLPGCKTCMFTCRQKRDARCLFWLYHTPPSKPCLYANTVCKGHLFNSAHLNYFLAPFTYTDCLCDDAFKSHPTLVKWSQPVSDKRGSIKITFQAQKKQFRGMR